MTRSASRSLGAVQHVPSLYAWALLARLPSPGIVLAPALIVVEQTGSYAMAGLVTGSLVVGQASRCGCVPMIAGSGAGWPDTDHVAPQAVILTCTPAGRGSPPDVFSHSG